VLYEEIARFAGITSQPDLFIIGLGVAIPGHITVEATQAMSRCARLYSIVQEPPRLWLPPENSGIEVINALEMYVEGSIRIQNYERVARTIVAALGGTRPLGYVTYGNPMAYDRVAQNLLEYAKESGFAVHVVPGISSFDTVLCDLNVDMAPAIQVFEASWLFACQIKPNVNIPALLMQVGAFGSLRTHYTQRQDGSSLRELVQYLCRFYPRSHPISLVCSSGQEGRPAKIRRVSLDDLCKVTADDLSGASLYIPAREKATPNAEIIGTMEQT
jgi:uncharacterized protein YabN with tetrapyrrole methylase and pyrophosphatase domain